MVNKSIDLSGTNKVLTRLAEHTRLTYTDPDQLSVCVFICDPQSLILQLLLDLFSDKFHYSVDSRYIFRWHFVHHFGQMFVLAMHYGIVLYVKVTCDASLEVEPAEVSQKTFDVL